MRYLTVDEVLALHERIIETSGGSPGLRCPAGLESAVAQAQVTFEGVVFNACVEGGRAGLLAHNESPVRGW